MHLPDCQSCPAQLQYNRELSGKPPPQSMQALPIRQTRAGKAPGTTSSSVSPSPALGSAGLPPGAIVQALSRCCSWPRLAAVGRSESGAPISCQCVAPLVPVLSCGSSDEPGALEELNEDAVHERVLAQRLHHHHPLLPQHVQPPRDVQHLIVFQAGDHDL